MTLSDEQIRRLGLGNCVDLPPTFPKPGSIYLVEGTADKIPIVCIEESDSAERVIRRFVRLDQLGGVFRATKTTSENESTDANRDDSDGGDARVSNRIEDMLTSDELLSRLSPGAHNKTTKRVLSGIAVVNGSASVLVQIEVATSAAESKSVSDIRILTGDGTPATVGPEPCCYMP